MARKDRGPRHPAIEDFERRYIGPSIEAEQRQEPPWPRGTERLYGYTPEYLAPGPEFDPRYQVDDPEDHTPSREHIREDVVEVLKREPELDASGITVEVTDECDLILRGKVARIADKRLAADLVADVIGVRDVHNDIRVIRKR